MAKIDRKRNTSVRSGIWQGCEGAGKETGAGPQAEKGGQREDQETLAPDQGQFNSQLIHTKDKSVLVWYLSHGRAFPLPFFIRVPY